jgi:hypothetical protein
MKKSAKKQTGENPQKSAGSLHVTGALLLQTPKRDKNCYLN